MTSNHDEYRKRQRLAKQGGPEYRATDYGKGDVARPVNQTAYDLGMKLLKLKKGTKEYEETLEAWKKALGRA
jgi:hypothetical protein